MKRKIESFGEKRKRLEAKKERKSKTMKIKLIGNIQSRRVWLNGEELELRKSQKIRNHSPDGFNWGYAGSVPAQLALSICIELFGAELAPKVYQDFKFKHIGALPKTDFNKEIELDETDLNKLIGADVCYIGNPRKGNENGIIKSVSSCLTRVWVVYSCDENWEEYQNYTGELTNLSDLKLGWEL